MSGLPSVTVIGTLVADPDLRFTPSGAAVANFTIAANARRLNKQTNEWEDGDATFLRCNLWRQAAENVAESLTRGMRVIAVGTLKQRQYEKDGEKRSSFELEVDEVGPSTKWATVKVNKVAREGGLSASAPRSSGPADDPFSNPDAGEDPPPF